jgi:hypothetical protein
MTEKHLNTYYSIRIVKAENLAEAIEMAEDNVFDETHKLSDQVVDGLDLMSYLPEFEQYEKESIKWSIADFLEMDVPDGYHHITEEQAQQALESMIYKHDAEHGIGWHTLSYYYTEYATQIEEESNEI